MRVKLTIFLTYTQILKVKERLLCERKCQGNEKTSHRLGETICIRYICLQLSEARILKIQQ